MQGAVPCRLNLVVYPTKKDNIKFACYEHCLLLYLSSPLTVGYCGGNTLRDITVLWFSTSAVTS